MSDPLRRAPWGDAPLHERITEWHYQHNVRLERATAALRELGQAMNALREYLTTEEHREALIIITGRLSDIKAHATLARRPRFADETGEKTWDS